MCTIWIELSNEAVKEALPATRSQKIQPGRKVRRYCWRRYHSHEETEGFVKSTAFSLLSSDF